MKPLSELVTKWLENAKNPRTDGTIAYNECADELQAWLREADWELVQQASRAISEDWVRHRLLGTTRTEGKK